MINLSQDEIQAEEFVWKSEFDEVEEIDTKKQKSAGNLNLGNLKNDPKNGDSIGSKTSDLKNDVETSKNEDGSLEGQSKESTSYLGMISNSFNSWFREGFKFRGQKLDGKSSIRTSNPESSKQISKIVVLGRSTY